MNNMQIFCPQNHLVLDQPACAHCGWQRPPQAAQGSLLWQPVLLEGGIGGPSRDVFCRPGVLGDIAVFPLRAGGLAALRRADGSIAWQTEPNKQLSTSALYPIGKELIASASDLRHINEAENGHLVRVDPASGEIEKLWEGSGFTLTDPVFHNQTVILRTATPRLVALDTADGYKLKWQLPLRSYKPIPPLVSADRVLVWDGEVTREDHRLKAFALQTGKALWECAMDSIDSPPAASDTHFIYRSKKSVVAALDIASGKHLWQKEFSRIYSSLALQNGRVYFMLRGDAPPESPERYILQSLDAASGEPLWAIPLGIRAQEILPQPDGSLLIGMGDDTVALCSPEDGSILWQYSFGDENINRVQTHLVFNDGTLWAGTYEGYAAALCLTEQECDPRSAEIYLKEGDYANAAAALALEGNLIGSADIYLDKLNQPLKAKAIFEHIQDIPGQIKTLIALGDQLGAARLYEQQGELEEAARLYEKENDLRKAMELYQANGNTQEAQRLREMVPLQLSDIERLVKEGRLEDAGDAALKLKAFDKAVDFYERAQNPPNEKLIDALMRLNDVQQEPWSLQRLAEVSRSLGRFDIMAEALKKLGFDDQAAYAYRNYARQLEERDRSNQSEIIRAYETAKAMFESEGMREEYQECREKLREYRNLPNIEISGVTDKAFREGEWNRLFVTLTNTGYGRADDIHFRTLNDLFEIDSQSFSASTDHLAAKRSKDVVLSIRPGQDQVGELPFMLEWEWKDRDNTAFRDKKTVWVTVKRKDDSKSDNTPVTIHAETYIAGDYHHEEASGDIVKDGAQKGDKVEINRDGRIKLTDEEMGEISPKGLISKCPNCSLPVEKGAKFCDACGHALKPKK